MLLKIQNITAFFSYMLIRILAYEKLSIAFVAELQGEI